MTSIFPGQWLLKSSGSERVKISYDKFPAILPMNENSTDNNEQFDDCSTKIYHIFSVIQVF